MVKRILPIYQTGWFYLLLLFWAFSYYYLATGGLNPLNQFNINLLNKLESTSSQEPAQLKASDILTLESSFDKQGIDSITALLLSQPNSQVTLLAKPSNSALSKLEQHLLSSPRKNKIVIAASNAYSAAELKPQPAMILASFIDWFRFFEEGNAEYIASQPFIFAPLLISPRQSFPLVWQQQDKTYLSLPSEILKQLSVNAELFLKQGWQLSLTNQHNELVPKKFPLGFYGEVFVTGDIYKNSQTSQVIQKVIRTDVTPVMSVSRYIAQQYSSSTTAFPAPQYKVIIISESGVEHYEILKPLLIKLIQHEYLYQTILTTIFSGLLTALGLILTWFIRPLTFQQQSICIASYSLAIFFMQCFFFNQQQWLAVIPLIALITGTWLLLLGYQKEYNLFITALNYQVNHTELPPTLTAKRARNSKVANAKRDHQLTNNKVTPTKVNEKVARVSHVQMHPPAQSVAEDDLEQTMVILDNPVQRQVQRQAKVKHHITVENFGRYQVEGLLGKGAMGIVYQGVDPKINRHVAIKTLQLSDDIDSDEFSEAKERFFREAQTAGGLSHANIVTIYDVGEEGNLGYIAMDLLTGAPLSLFTQAEQTLPVPLVYQLLIQITDALDYAHQQNVVHRDIKPANIIYDDDLLKVTVTDFGIAYVSDNSKTRTGIIMGSPYYMSPEQILGLKVDGRSDIFSLGVTFYQLLCGHLPFEGESIATVAYQITKTKAIAVNQHNLKLPASAVRITNKAMHKDIEKRYQTMAEFKLALVNALKRDFKITAS